MLAATPIAPTIDILGEHFTDGAPRGRGRDHDRQRQRARQPDLGGLAGDVFASVGSPAVDDLALDGHLAVQPFVFARDPLVLIVPPGNPEGLTGIDDLANADRTIALCSLDTACGQATDAALMRAGITASPDVAGDRRSHGGAGSHDRTGVRRPRLPHRRHRVGRLPRSRRRPQADVPAIAVKLAATTNPAAADAFIAYLFSPEAKQVLATIGLVPPPAACRPAADHQLKAICS